MQEDDLASLDWTGVLPRWKTHTVTDAWCCILPCARRDLRSRACARPCANEQATRPYNVQLPRIRIVYSIHIPVAFSLLQPRCWNYDARYSSNYSSPARTCNTNSPFFARVLFVCQVYCLSLEKKYFPHNMKWRTYTNTQILTNLFSKASLANH